MKISKQQARNLAVHSALGVCRGLASDGLSRTNQIIEHLGYVQIDTLQVIERAHHHVIWTRYPEYRPEYLDQLFHNRQVFEYWTHALAYVPMCDFRFYLTRMEAFYDPHDKWEKDRLKKYGHLLAPVLDVLQELGDSSASQVEFGLPGNPDQRSVRAALDVLFFSGEIMVSRRDGFKKIYDLAERVLPKDINKLTPNEDELIRFYIKRAIQIFGVANKREISAFLGNVNKNSLSARLDDMVTEKILDRCEIHGINSQYFLNPGLIQVADKGFENSCHFLSPFDPLIIQRERLKNLFGFDYHLECYVPAAKRKYGYFVLPILYQNRFIGRLDCKVDRKKKIMRIINLYFEETFNDHQTYIPVFVDELVRFAEFNSCDEIIIESIIPKKLNQYYKDNIIPVRFKLQIN